MEWSWVDAVLAGILLLSVVVGMVRGLVFEMMSLLGWLVAYFGALWLAPQWASWLPVGRPGSAENGAAALVISFVAVLIVWGLMSRLVRWLVHATPLSLVDRSLGASFGLLRGALIVLCVVTAVSFTPWAQEARWQSSQGVRWAGEALALIKPWLPGLFEKSLSARKWSIGVSCKAQSTAIPVGITAIPVGIASICNAADHFKRPFHGWQGLSEQALVADLSRFISV